MREWSGNCAARADDTAMMQAQMGMMQQGQLPLIFQFEEDLKSLTSKVNELNDELLRFNEQYSTLFLSVRKASKLASIATSVSKPQ